MRTHFCEAAQDVVEKAKSIRRLDIDERVNRVRDVFDGDARREIELLRKVKTAALFYLFEFSGEIELLDARSDIYALGAILFEILHLRPAVTGITAMEIVDKVTRGEAEWMNPKAKSEHRKSALPASLLAVVRKALALDVAARYPRVEDLQADVLAYQNGFATSAEKAGAWKQFTLLVKRNKAASIGLAAVLLVGGTLGTKAIIEGRKAEKALANLRGTAPTFHEQALALIRDGQLDAALAKIGTAIDLVPSADYLATRGRIFQSLARFREAGDAFSAALAADPSHALARANVELSRMLVGKLAPDGTLPKAGKETLLAALEKQGRRDEALLLANALGRTANFLRDEIVQRLQHTLQWDDSRKAELAKRIGTDDTGGLSVDLSKLPISDLSPLQGLPIVTLNIEQTAVSTLQPLAGMPLKYLNAEKAKLTSLQPLKGMALIELNVGTNGISDLSPLQGMPLEKLIINYSKVSDLSPLRGMPLKKLCVEFTPISDLTPLKELRLTELQAGFTHVHDLTPLSGMPLTGLSLMLSSGVTDLEPLRGLPLEWLDLAQTGISDLSPLEGMPILSLDLSVCVLLSDLHPLERLPLLESVSLPLNLTDLDFLRRHPKLRSFRWLNRQAFVTPDFPLVPAPRFWKHYDELKAAEKKFAVAFAEQGATFTPGKHLTSTRGEYFEADLTGTPLRDLRFLEGLPVAVLRIANTRISDLTPVAKCPLAELRATGSALETLAPLASARLTWLDIQNTKVTDLTPLRDMPLTIVFLSGSSVKDVSPLATCRSLTALVLPAGAEGIETLRPIFKAGTIGYKLGSDVGTADKTAAEFWQRYDALKAAGQK